MKIAIIPARGGSKRIPRKNIKPFLGRPIITYSINAALQSGCFDTVMVSTEDEEIAEIAQSFGASVPFMRSKETANDHATTAAVLTEVLNRYDQRFDLACCIYPAAPLITGEMLKTALAFMESEGGDSCIPVYPVQVWRAMKVEDGRLSRIFPHQNTRTQDLPPTYADAGQFYWFRVERFLREGRILNDNTAPFLVSPMDVQDIDTPEDWEAAEAKYNL